LIKDAVRVVRKSGRDYGIVWSRLPSPVVEVGARDILYLAMHNNLPVPEILIIIRLKYCQVCEVADLEHFF
jgi:hypothetical protein